MMKLNKSNNKICHQRSPRRVTHKNQTTLFSWSVWLKLSSHSFSSSRFNSIVSVLYKPTVGLNTQLFQRCLSHTQTPVNKSVWNRKRQSSVHPCAPYLLLGINSAVNTDSCKQTCHFHPRYRSEAGRRLLVCTARMKYILMAGKETK